MDIGLLIAVIGFGLFCTRLNLFSSIKINRSPQDFRKKVSIVIPCRNEAANVAALLTSLTHLTYPHLEIIVVNDNSEDHTASIAQSFNVTVLQAQEKPTGWSGKNWPCWIGAQAATGDYILFTDADTRHLKESLEKALTFINDTASDFISAPPYHRCENRWDQALGFFHLLPLFITNYLKPQEHRLFAIGQYLLLKKTVYFKLGGHSAIAGSLVDDIDLAKLCIKENFKYQVYPRNDLFEVQMYQTFGDFIKGWTRLIRLGLPRSQFVTFVEVFCLFNFILYVYTGANFILSFLGIIALTWAQRYQGNFRLWGVLFAPMNALLFIYLTLKANLEVLMKNKITWRGRSYLGGLLVVLSLLLGEKSMAANIKLHITDFRSGKGAIAVSLFKDSSKSGFPGKAGQAFKTLYVPLDGQVAVDLNLGDIPPGRYAVALLHDENGDRKYNSNIVGVPLEGFGFSGNPKVFVGAPSFEKCSFEVGQDDKPLTIKMKYFL